MKNALSILLSLRVSIHFQLWSQEHFQFCAFPVNTFSITLNQSLDDSNNYRGNGISYISKSSVPIQQTFERLVITGISISPSWSMDVSFRSENRD